MALFYLFKNPIKQHTSQTNGECRRRVEEFKNPIKQHTSQTLKPQTVDASH